MEGPVSGLEAYSEWQERLKRFESSGLSTDVFCQQEDVGQSTFLDWLRVLKGEQLRPAGEARSAEGPAFVPVTVKANMIEILLPGGGRVRLSPPRSSAVLSSRQPHSGCRIRPRRAVGSAQTSPNVVTTSDSSNGTELGGLMSGEEPFRWLLVAGFAAVIPVGLYHRIRSQATHERLDRRQEGWFILTTLRPVASILGTLAS